MLDIKKKYSIENKSIREFKFNRERDRFLAHVFCMEKGKGFITENNVPFRVNFYEIFFITDGEGYLMLDSERIEVRKSTVLCLPPWKVRRWDMKTPPKGYALIFEEEFFSGYFNDNLFIHRFNIFNNISLPSGFILEKEVFSSMLLNINELLKERQQVNWDSPHIFRATYYLLLTKINREYVNQFGLKTEIHSNNILLQFKIALEENIKELHKVEDYAQILNISRTHLNNTSNKILGKTAKNVIDEYLIAKIKGELLYSNKSISEIAYDLSFSDSSNFFRFFVKMTGFKPKEFQREFSK